MHSTKANPTFSGLEFIGTVNTTEWLSKVMAWQYKPTQSRWLPFWCFGLGVCTSAIELVGHRLKHQGGSSWLFQYRFSNAFTPERFSLGYLDRWCSYIRCIEQRNIDRSSSRKYTNKSNLRWLNKYSQVPFILKTCLTPKGKVAKR